VTLALFADELVLHANSNSDVIIDQMKPFPDRHVSAVKLPRFFLEATLLHTRGVVIPMYL